MAGPFEIVVQKLIDLGFYNFLFPFIITAAIFYALLRRAKIFGESLTVNAVISISIAFLIFGYPVIAGVSLTTPLSTFFTQATVWLLIVFVGAIIASLFYPNFSEMLIKQFTHRTTFYAMIVLGIALFVTSGLLTVFTTPPPTTPGAPPGPPTDVILIAAGLIIFIVLLFVASAIGRSTG